MGKHIVRARRLPILGGILACAVAFPGLAAAQSPLTPDEARKRLDNERGKLEAKERRGKDLQADVDKINAERERINARLVETAKLVQQSEGQLNLIESRLGELDVQQAHLRETLEARRGSISALLAAMLRMGRNPPPVMVASRKDVLSSFRSGTLLTPVLHELGGEAKALTEQLADLARVMRSIRTEGERLRTETTRLNDARLRLAGLQESKRQSLAERQEELAQVRKAATDISRSVSDLSELISKLDKEVAEKTGLGSYDQEVAAAGPQPSPAQQSDGKATSPAPPAAAPRDPSVVLAPGSDRVAMLTPGRIKPAIPFPEAKGLLPLPAQGRRVLTFGEKTQYGSQSRGLVLETRHGGQVVSPSDGWIVYAGEFRSYGQLLIINAGGGYHILLAGLSQIDVQLGQFVLAGEPVGVMSAAAKSPQAKAQDNAPILYIEFRKDKQPIDPDPWWSDASRKVQG
ncbi:MAG TPA: peptidoglycan DD-metalloendopeptidase family protein [Hyphomicrobiaceae bacterium]|nr:peptidoglycan DD-metalloendopeptidase family protein [Hyphomicrobiaceae bacterium]